MLDTIFYTIELWSYTFSIIIFKFIPWLYRWKLLEVIIGLIVLWRYFSGWSFAFAIVLIMIWIGIHL